MAHLGVFSSYVDWKSLRSRYPLRALQLIEAVVSTWDSNPDEEAPNGKSSRGQGGRLENWYDEDVKALNSIANNYPFHTWDLFMPHIERITAFETKPFDRHMENWQENRLAGRYKTHTEIERGIVELVMLAGSKLAAEQPEALLKRSVPLENSISSFVQEILVNVYAHLSVKYSDIGIRWLLDDLPRLCLGSGFDEPEWMPAARLVEALSPYCSEELFGNLEQAIFYYHSPTEKRSAEYYLKGWKEGFFGDYWGRAQYFLLPALDSKRVQSSTSDLIAVLKRKYANYSKKRFLRAGRISGGVIGSKLDASVERISDRAWLEIVSNKGIPEQDNLNWVQVGEDRAVTSTVRQFSRNLEQIAIRFPERFAQLSLHFPKDVHPLYISAIFQAMRLKESKSDISEKERADWRPASVKTVEEIIERFQTEDDRETAMSFCRLIRERAEENWSDKAIKRLIHYATNHPDLEPGKLNLSCDKTSDEASVNTLYQNTLNCVRGVAAEAIGQLLWNHKDLLKKLQPGIESLVNDPHPAVRMATIDALLPILNINKDLAVAWFCKVCADDLRVAASPRAVLFFNHTIVSHFDQIGPLIKCMVRSPNNEVSQEGAKEVTARWLFHEMFREELADCREGTIPQRKGVTQVASTFLRDEQYSMKCQDLLYPFFDDPEKDVRAETWNMFHNNALILQTINKEFLKTYIRSKAFTDHPSRLVYSLKDLPCSLIPFAEAIFVLCEVFSTTLQEKSQEMGSDVPHIVSEISSLLLRLYEQSQDSENAEINNRCLDIWDMLFENRVGIVRELTSAIERV